MTDCLGPPILTVNVKSINYRAVSDLSGRGSVEWIFSNSGCHAEAAAVYRQLLSLLPDWIDGHRHLSGSLAAAGQFDEAIAHGTGASNAAPHNGEFALHAGSLLAAAGRPGDAADYFYRALAAEPDNPIALCCSAAARAALG